MVSIRRARHACRARNRKGGERVMKAIIPASGLGTRFLPGTKAIPKELLLLMNKPVIQYGVEEALNAGFDEVIIVNSHAKPAIEEHFAPNPDLVNELRSRGKDAYANEVERTGNLPVSFVYQNEALGLGHAVYCGAEKTANESFAVILGDTVVPEADILKQMVAISNQHDGSIVLAAMPVNPEAVERFGIIDGYKIEDGILKVNSVVEKPAKSEAPTNYAIFGRYILTPRVMDLLETTQPGAGGEIQLTDAILSALRQEEAYALIIDPNDVFDTGTVEGWIEANTELLARANATKETCNHE